MSDYANSMNVHNKQDGREAGASLKGINFSDALGPASVRTRRAMLALAVVAVVFALYPVNVKQIPWLDIPAPEEAGTLVPSLLLAALIYHWVSFALYALADLTKWEGAISSSIFSSTSQLVYRLDEHVRRLAQQLEQLPKDGDLATWRAQQEPVARDAREVANSAIAEWRRYYGISRFGFKLKRATAWLWEVILPLAFGGWGAWRLFEARL